MAGAGSAENKDTLISLLQKIGFDRNKIIVTHDGQIAIDLIEKKGIILIAGTGSICMAKKDSTMYRVGGLGKVLGDEGSGFTIGKKAIKATLEEEQGWGERTDLSPALKKFFDVKSLLKLAGPITQGAITSAHIASTAPIVFDRAQAHDAVAVRIINQAAQELSEMLAHIIALSDLSHCPIYLYGGIFKSSSSDAFIKKIMEHPKLKNKNLIAINNASSNAALLYARQWVKNL
jgi:N-acetylglucosamine kinase-like BadF-type ATPase